MTVTILRNRIVEPTFYDDFLRADTTTITTGAPFALTEEAGDLEILTNRLHSPGAGVLSSFQVAQDLASDDTWARVRCPLATGAGGYEAVWAKVRDLSATAQGYSARLRPTNECTLWKLNSGGGEVLQLGSTVTETWANGDTIECQVKQAVMRALRNGVEKIRATDTAYTTGKRVGGGLQQVDSSNDIFLDQFRAGAYLNVPQFTNLVTGGSATDATSYATASVTPASGILVLCGIVHERTGATPSAATSVTGASISGAVKIATVAFLTLASPTALVEIWAALGTGSAGAITFSYGVETQIGAAWAVTTVSNVDTSKGTLGVLQSVVGSNNAATSFVTAALAAFKSPENPAFAVVGTNVNAAITSGGGWAQIGDVGATTPAQRIHTQYTSWEPTSAPNATGSSSSAGMIALELAGNTVNGPLLLPSLILPQSVSRAGIW